MMKTIIALTIVVTFAFPAFADGWPTKVAQVGCKFEFVEKVGEWEKYNTLEILEHLPFPQLRIKREVEGKSTSASIAKKLGLPDNGEVMPSVFCDTWCKTRDNDFALEQSELFPLEVGKRFEINARQKVIFEVLEDRSSPYFEGTKEYYVQAALDILGDGSNIMPSYRVWWNIDLSFFTERENLRNMIYEKISSTTCSISD